MRILRCTNQIELLDSYGEKTILEKNLDYIVPDNVVEIILNSQYGNSIEKNEDFYDKYLLKQYRGQDLTGKSIITFRNGGIGDLVFQLPSLKKLKEDTGVKVTVVCNKKYKYIFEGLDYVDEIKSLPFTTDDIDQKDYYINFEGLIEHNPDAEIHDAYSLHANKFFVQPENFTPELYIDEDIEQKVIKEISNYKCEKRIVIAWSASVPIRSINPNVYANVIASTPENYRFFICGSKKNSPEIKNFINQIPQFKNKITNWAEKYDDLRYSMALIKNSDCVIGPDSGLLHVAGGFGTPIIGLFGAFPSRLRLCHYKNAIGVNARSTCIYGRGETNNCFQHGSGNCHLAQRKMEYFSPCMSAISHIHVLESLKRLKLL